jgi:adenosylmethionine-8-amino-7-oxononanoate aminotransferase
MNKELKYFLNGEYKKKVIFTDRYWIYFEKEKKPYLDLQCGYSSFILGYNNKEIYSNLEKDYDVQFVRGVTCETNTHVDALSKKLCSLGNWSTIAWTTSGSDAVEAAYEMNRKYWNLVNPAKNKILVFLPNYHGTTLLEKHFRQEVDNIDVCKFLEVIPWNNYSERQYSEKILLNKIIQTLTINKMSIGAILMESIPWFDYLQPWSKLFWSEVRKICNEYNVNLIIDDVAGCYGKEGSWFSNDTYDIKPDIVAIGKAFSAGYAPMGAALCNNKIHEILSKDIWEHTHTYYPSMYGVLISNRTINYIEKNNLFDTIPSLNQRVKNIGKKYNIPVIGDNLLVSLHFPKSLTISDVFETNAIVSLPIKGYNGNILKICIPLIADSEYFFEIENIVRKLYDKSNR